MSKQEKTEEFTIRDGLDVPEESVTQAEIMLIKSCLSELMVEVLKIVGEDES